MQIAVKLKNRQNLDISGMPIFGGKGSQILHWILKILVALKNVEKWATTACMTLEIRLQKKDLNIDSKT